MVQENERVILTIDDEPIIRETFRAYLEDYNYTVLTAENGAAGLEILEKEKVDLVLVDLRMPDVDGLAVLAEVEKDFAGLPVIVVSGTGEISDVVEALRRGAWDYLLKPVSDLTILRHAIEKCLERADLIAENRNYQVHLEELVRRKTQELGDINIRLRDVVVSMKKLLGCGVIEESGALLLGEFGKHMEATGGSIYQVTSEGLGHIASLDHGQVAEIISFPLEKGSVFKRVMESKEPLLAHDIESEGSVVPSGWQEYRHNSLLVFPILDDEEEITAIISLHSKKKSPFTSQDRDIGRILASYTGEALKMAGISRALKSSEERLRQAQKMEAIGTLAGGIAHDFNNILAAIIGYTDLSLFSDTCSDIVRQNLEQVKSAGNRAKDLVAQILAFSRTEEFQEDAVDVVPIMKEALKLLRATIPSSIAIDTDLADGLGKVVTDPTRIYQVLMNLCTNAVHAMGGQDGRLFIGFTKVEKERAPAEIQAADIDNWLELTIADNGAGICQEDLERIFDPYYTTKEKGEGTGLGLAMVHTIVRASGGIIQVESELGVGSTFHLFFPSVNSDRESSTPVPLSNLPKGTECILLVDDERILAEMAGEILESLGYRVRVYSSSTEALADFSRSPADFDLLISDQTMPEMNGLELVGGVLKIRPDLPVILCTGYSATMDMEKVRSAGIREVVMKPLSMSMLADVVRKTLDG